MLSKATYNSKDGQLKVYVDGILSGQSVRAGKPTPGMTPVTFGHWNGGSRFRGIIDEVAIFNIALAETDIMKIATEGLAAVALGGGKSVDASGKLATAWGALKN